MKHENDIQHRVKKKFFDFTAILKDAGVELSTVEVMDMFEALQYVEFNDKNAFKQALSSTLIKDYTDLPVFERCFERFFEKKTGDSDAFLDTLIERSIDQLKSHDDQKITDEQMIMLQEQVEKFLDDQPSESLFEKTPEQLLSLFLESLEESPESGGGGLGFMLFSSRGHTSSPGISEEDSDETGDDATLDDDLYQMMLEMLKNRRNEKTIGTEQKKHDEYLLNKFIYQLTPEEIKEMRELIMRFGQKMKNRISLRKKKIKHGSLDVKRTFRSNMQYGSIPFRLYYRDKRIDRPQLIVLCDISSSVNQYSRFMLLLTYTLQSLFSKVRTFAFISNMVEITELFREMDPERALSSIFSDTDFTYGWGSNYGNSFNQFMENYSDSLSHKSTVLVIGDARNNNQDPGMKSFLRIKERSRNLFWLNPDKRHLWDWSDSIATVYEPHCTEMREVNNVIDLADFIDKLFVEK